MSLEDWGAKLHPNFDAEVVNSDDYEHWTAGDLIDILSDYPPDAKVWVADPVQADREVLAVWPIELISGHGDPGYVILG